jgi:hypothetical protein
MFGPLLLLEKEPQGWEELGRKRGLGAQPGSSLLLTSSVTFPEYVSSSFIHPAMNGDYNT